MDISVIIPAYKELDKIPDTLNNLKFDGKFEVIVAGDVLSKEDITFLKKQKHLNLTLSKSRRGKVKAMNAAVKMSTGKLLVFIDSDTRPENKNFLTNIWKVYTEKGFDMATGKLMVEGTSLLERSVNVEYLFMNTAFFVINKIGKTMPVCGALLLMDRSAFEGVGGFSNVLVEDFDMGFKAVKNKLKFGYIKEAGVFTASPKKIRDWWVQRKRWWVGAAQTLKHSKKDMIKNLPTTTTSMGTYYPLVATVILSTLAVLSFASKFQMSYVLSLTAFLTSSWMLIMNKVLDWGISMTDGLSYLLLYGPIYSVLTLSSIFYFSFKKAEITDWKV
ncbi:MAG: glycosyltransferase family 2 protein [Candidatus Altiarchaeota archaeon]|nr:glycosyltransferase family 2 protein [Candidatus Altiarchaeota archaeon]